MSHPSLKTLTEINHEDWAQRYKSSFILYDKKCYYVQEVAGRANLYLNDGSGTEEEPAAPPRFVPHRARAPVDPYPSMRGMTWALPFGLNKIDFYAHVGEVYFGESWFYNQRSIGSRDNILAIFPRFFRSSSKLKYLLSYWTEEDQDTFIEIFRNRSELHHRIDAAGYTWNRSDTAGEVTAAITQHVRGLSFRYFARHGDWTDREFAHYVTRSQELEHGGEPRFNFVVGMLGAEGIPERRPERDVPPRPTTNPARERTSFTVTTGYGTAGWDEVAVPEMKAKSKSSSVKIDISKLSLERPESRWFLDSKGKPYFISYATMRQYKRGLTAGTAPVFSNWTAADVMMHFPTSFSAKLGCPVYEAAYLFKNPTIVRKTINQIRDELKAKGFSYLSPVFLINKDILYYKNVALGLVKPNGEIGLKNSAFKQEIEELIYNPRVEFEYKMAERDF